jgi:transposase
MKAGDLTCQEYRDAAKSEVDRSVEYERNEIMFKTRSAGAGSAIPVDDQVDEGFSKSPT